MSELGWYFKQKQITPRNYLLYEREIYMTVYGLLMLR